MRAAAPDRAIDSPWARYSSVPGDPWDLRKVAHLHRRAGFGATRAELLRDLAAGPEASLERLFNPSPLSTEAVEAIDSLRQTARVSSNIDLLKVCWLNRIVHGPDPLREKLTLFWHGHFATSNKKVESVSLMDRQNETIRTNAAGSFAGLLEVVIADPAMLVWLDGGTSKKSRPNENFARVSGDFHPGAGNYTERDIRESARAFVGWAQRVLRAAVRKRPTSSMTLRRLMTEPRPSSARPDDGGHPTSFASSSIAPRPRSSWRGSSTGSS